MKATTAPKHCRTSLPVWNGMPCKKKKRMKKINASKKYLHNFYKTFSCCKKKKMFFKDSETHLEK